MRCRSRTAAALQNPRCSGSTMALRGGGHQCRCRSRDRRRTRPQRPAIENAWHARLVILRRVFSRGRNGRPVSQPDELNHRVKQFGADFRIGFPLRARIVLGRQLPVANDPCPDIFGSCGHRALSCRSPRYGTGARSAQFVFHAIVSVSYLKRLMPGYCRPRKQS